MQRGAGGENLGSSLFCGRQQAGRWCIVQAAGAVYVVIQEWCSISPVPWQVMVEQEEGKRSQGRCRQAQVQS